MFDRGVVGADAFTEMSSDAQSLYFHLGVQADDEGFVSPRGVMRMISAPEDSLKVLIAKKFVIPFKSGVVVITDWNENNYLDQRRIKPTKHQKERSELVLTTDGKYEFNNGLADAKQMRGQYSVVESRVEEKSIDTVEKIDSPFSMKEEIKKLEDNKRRDMNIIALYLEKRKPDIRTKDQFNVTLRRHLRAAKQLSAFDDGQIIKACAEAEKEYPKLWTIETLVKLLTK